MELVLRLETVEGMEKKDCGNFGWKLPVEKNDERVGKDDEGVEAVGDATE